jgi:hypothetical protein
MKEMMGREAGRWLNESVFSALPFRLAQREPPERLLWDGERAPQRRLEIPNATQRGH